MTDRWDDRELERLMKEGLESRAREADVDVAVADRARAAARGTRWRTAAAAGLVAASVAGVAGGVVLLRDDEPRSGGVTGATDETPIVVDEWRTEYWHDIQVDVPADWGWGASPMAESIGRGGLIGCYPSAFRDPDGPVSDRAEEITPYVGRPFALTDFCELYRDDQWPEPEAPYVWLGTPIEPGIREFDNGYVQETIEFEGEPVTVATDDPALRQQILDSVTGGETCLSEYDDEPVAASSFDLVDGVRAVTVCAYHHDTPAEPLRLAYAVELPGSAGDRLAAALAAAPPVDLDCSPGDGNSLVQLDVQSKANPDLINTYLVRTGSCFGIETGQSMTPLTKEIAASWAVAGVPTVVYASGPSWIYDYFIGPQG
jgi:hypothetical protein